MGIVALVVASSTSACLADAGAANAPREPSQSAAAMAEGAAAKAMLAEAEALEQRGELAVALERYRALARGPLSQEATWAARRAALLESHSEGDFAPLWSLLRLRSDPAALDTVAEAKAAADEAATYPPGPVRSEVRLLVAEALLGRLDATGEALPLLRAAAEDDAADPLLRRQAATLLVEAELASGELEAARRDAARLDPSPATVEHVRAQVRRRRAVLVSLAVVSTAAVGTLYTILRSRDRGRGLRAVSSWLGSIVAFALVLALGGGALALALGGTPWPFVGLGGAGAAVVATARWTSAVGRTTTAARVGRAALFVATTLAVAVLVLAGFGDTLASFGL